MSPPIIFDSFSDVGGDLPDKIHTPPLPVQRGRGEEFVSDNSKCYFLPAEERKRQKIFSHTLPKGLGLRTGGKGRVGIKRGADGRIDGAERIGGAEMGIKHGYGDKTRIWG